MKKSISSLGIRFWSNNLNRTDVSKVFGAHETQSGILFQTEVVLMGPHGTGPWDKLSETNGHYDKSTSRYL